MCKVTFQNAGPLWFASSPGKETPIMFTSDEDFMFVMNVIAQIAFLFPYVIIVSFEVMDNHFHFIIECETKEMIHEFFASVKKRLQRFFPQIKPIELDIRSIDSLNSLRNRIAYTHRNGYVADPDCTPFSYKWGTGRYYFNDYPYNSTLGDMTVRARRVLFKGRDPQLPDEWSIVDNHVDPRNYCSVRFGMAVFRDAHHYFTALTKNVESYSELAEEFGDIEFLTDQELYDQLRKIIREKYTLSSPRELSKAQRLDLARTLHYDYRSSNSQIRRVLGLTQYEVDSLFPLGK